MTGYSKLLTLAGTTAVSFLAVPIAIKALRAGKPKKSDDKGHAEEFEFGGPVGAYFTMVALPGVVFMIYYACGKNFVMKGLDLKALLSIPLPEPKDLVSSKALAVVTGWMGFQVLLERILPGQVVQGVDLAAAGGKPGTSLGYRMNGHKAFWVSMGLAGALFSTSSGRDNLAWLYDNYAQVAGASMIVSAVLSVYLYASSFKSGALLARGGDSGNAVYDFFIGRELNPRVPLPCLYGGVQLKDLDLKQFCELRPGLIGWALLNVAMAAKQYQNTSSVSASLGLVTLLQGLYVWDALYQEQAILSTMDITTDGFGFMLAFGDLSWVPFTYGIQARYLVDHNPGLSPIVLTAVASLGLLGYYVFRCSNSEKDAFRRNPQAPEVRHLKTLKVTNYQSGKPSQLLISGWWGMARKINYTGDWLMAYSWSMLTGCPFMGDGSLLTYFYPIYFAILLIHRAGRDDHFCSQKYGEGWKEYKKHVPAMFIPYLL